MYKDCRYWNPTLVKLNGLFYVVATNSSLDDAIKDIPLNDSLDSIARLAHHGIRVSRSVLNDISTEITDDELLLATESEITIEYDVEKLTRMLTLIKADYVLIREWNMLAKDLAIRLKESLERQHISTDILERNTAPLISTASQAKMPVLIGGYSYSSSISKIFAKNIGLTNSNPIIIK